MSDIIQPKPQEITATSESIKTLCRQIIELKEIDSDLVPKFEDAVSELLKVLVTQCTPVIMVNRGHDVL